LTEAVLVANWVQREGLVEDQEWTQGRLDLTSFWKFDVKVEERFFLVLVHYHVQVLSNVEGINNGELVGDSYFWNHD